ncbi:ROK family protein [Glutamicibacter arilaitensis]|uniref:ROK family protein n=1 Tax=Glutamicibacter arilaitensis TaxID=256701 RepID=UPI00384FA287
MKKHHFGAGAVLALDVGGTKIAGAVLDSHRQIIATGQVPTPASAGAPAVLDAMARLVAQLRGKTTEEILGLGLGAAGVIDPANARVSSATDTIAGWAGTDLRTELMHRTGLPVRAVNDVHAHGLGEAHAGAGRDAEQVLLFAVGTGIGGAHLLNGQLHSGAHHVAGHMGHVDSPLAAGLPCSCGRTGHVEAIAAGPAIHRNYLRLGGDQRVADTRELAARAVQGDELARTALRTGARAAGMALASLANVLDPDLIIVSGGMAGAGDIWWHALRAGYADSIIDLLAHTPIVPAQLGNDAAFYGAASLFWSTNERN